jgi:serine/threonine protein kinase
MQSLASLIYRGCGASELPASTYLAEYKELSLLGGGAFGKVYKAQNHLDQQEWAVKQIVSVATTALI